MRYGLAAVLLGSAVEGDFTLILAGVCAHLGYFPFPLAVAAGALGSFVGDLAWYVLGRLRGPRFRAGRLYRRVGPRIETLARRLGPAAAPRRPVRLRDQGREHGVLGIARPAASHLPAGGWSRGTDRLGRVHRAGLPGERQRDPAVREGPPGRSCGCSARWSWACCWSFSSTGRPRRSCTSTTGSRRTGTMGDSAGAAIGLPRLRAQATFRCMDPDLLLAGLQAGKTAALARAISVVENARPGFERLLAGVHRSLGRARRIGITGPPGAGKSTLVERLVTAYRQRGSPGGGRGRRSHQPLHRRRPPRRPHPHGIRGARRGRLHPLHGKPRVARRARHHHARGVRPARRRRLRPDPGRDGGRGPIRARRRAAWPTPPCWCWCPSRATASRRSSRA